jgi:Dolichyl-phosphate-mannose-protein mannosyltransferase
VAISSGDWRSTYQQYHPGVTVMAIGGISLRAYDAVKGTPAESLFRWAAPQHATALGREIAAGVLGLAVVEALAIATIGVVLARFADPILGLATSGFLAFSPAILSENRVFHPDGLAGLLMLLSALLLLFAADQRRQRMVPLSGVVAGLALLTKTPSLFLVPFAALSLFAFSAEHIRFAWGASAFGRGRRLGSVVWRSIVQPSVVWGMFLALPFALWPVMWVRPIWAVSRLVSGLSAGVFRPHRKPMFFVGQIYEGQTPPLLFYPVVLAYQSTCITLTLVVAAVLLYALRRSRVRLPIKPAIFWLLIAYTVFFTAQMALSSKQPGSRYVYPAQAALELIAAVGLVSLATAIREAWAPSSVRAASLGGALVAGAVALQALIALLYAPDYGAHHNALLGGNPAALRLIPITDDNEGIIELSTYIQSLGGAESAVVATTRRAGESLRQYFPGTVIDRMPAPADYYLFDRASVQRHINHEQWELAWNEFRPRRPVAVVLIDRVAFLWLYETRGEPTETVEIRRGWAGMGAVAVAWTVAIVALLVWISLRRRARGPGSNEPSSEAGDIDRPF